MGEVNLLRDYPKTKRKLEERKVQKAAVDAQKIARKFGKEFFDGDRKCGYGGYYYNSRFWQPVVKTFKEYYGLTSADSILDVGCGKGFMLHDFKEILGAETIAGIDISEYAIEHSMEDIRPFLRVGNAKELPYETNSFDIVVSINTTHNLPIEECKQALREIERVSRGKSFITVDAWRNDNEKEEMEAWNLTALTYMHVDDWKKLFEEVGYTGDYYWFFPSE